MHHDAILLAATVLIAAGVASVVVFRRAGFGSVLGLLATGVIVGPSGLAITNDVATFRSITELGVVLLLFVIGLEMEPRRLWAIRRLVFGMGLAQVGVTGIVLTAGAMLLGHRLEPALVMGLGLALSSTAFVMQMLEERGELLMPHGEGAFGVLLLQDLMVVPLLMLVGLLGNAPLEASVAPPMRLALAVGMLALVAAAGLFLLPRALAYAARQGHAEAFAGLALLAVVLSAWAMETAGLSMALGAFLMGMLLSRSRYHHQLEADVAPFKGALLSLFFISVGMSIDLDVLTHNLFAIAGVVAAIIIAKLTVLLLVARLFGSSWDTSLRLAALLAQGGEFGFVLFGAAHVAGILDDNMFVQTILVISTSMALTPLLFRGAVALARRLHLEAPSSPGGVAALDRHVVLCGFGRAGRTIGAMLEAAGLPYLAIEADARRVEVAEAAGLPVIFGNAADRKLLDAAGIGRAAAVVVTLDKVPAASRVVSAIRNFHPEVPVLARARDLGAREAMLALGVSQAIPETVEMSLALGEATLRRLGIGDDMTRLITDQLRADELADLKALERMPKAMGSRRTRAPD